MSQGKQAFVILKLLLEFSKKECPILIDQPEDSLDNRAIYNELVKYIIDKKKERQIILVTHNSNVVVSADAEQIIVANQHGEKIRIRMVTSFSMCQVVWNFQNQETIRINSLFMRKESANMYVKY